MEGDVLDQARPAGAADPGAEADLRLGLVHRVYRVSRGSVIERHGADAASAVPDGGLTDVHRYLVMTLAGGK